MQTRRTRNATTKGQNPKSYVKRFNESKPYTAHNTGSINTDHYDPKTVYAKKPKQKVFSSSYSQNQYVQEEKQAEYKKALEYYKKNEKRRLLTAQTRRRETKEERKTNIQKEKQDKFEDFCKKEEKKENIENKEKQENSQISQQSSSTALIGDQLSGTSVTTN